MVRAQEAPFYLMDVKNSLGSGIGVGVGLALSLAKRSVVKHVVALCGDSGFIHSGMNGLIDAVQLGVRMLVLLLDNGTTALSGRQPHPASGVDARGKSRPAVDIEALARGTGAGMIHVVDLDHGDDIRAAIEEGIQFEGVAVLIVRGRCILE
jgi:indolepyruvate ferredoxin oxidoreductase alpha subunit